MMIKKYSFDLHNPDKFIRYIRSRPDWHIEKGSFDAQSLRWHADMVRNMSFVVDRVIVKTNETIIIVISIASCNILTKLGPYGANLAIELCVEKFFCQIYKNYFDGDPDNILISITRIGDIRFT